MTFGRSPDTLIRFRDIFRRSTGHHNKVSRHLPKVSGHLLKPDGAEQLRFSDSYRPFNASLYLFHWAPGHYRVVAVCSLTMAELSVCIRISVRVPMMGIRRVIMLVLNLRMLMLMRMGLIITRLP